MTNHGNRDRFLPPHLRDASLFKCASCGAEGYDETMMYDTLAEEYICDITCAHEWADANFDKVIADYIDRNVEGG